MSNSTAWDIASVSPAARRIAERAASRAGVTLEAWLDLAIAGQASTGDLHPAAPAIESNEDPAACARTALNAPNGAPLFPCELRQGSCRSD